jgi:hypothetical protein
MPQLSIPMAGDGYILNGEWAFRLYKFSENKEIVKRLFPEWAAQNDYRLSSRWIANQFNHSLPNMTGVLPEDTKLIFSKISRHVPYSYRGEAKPSFVIVNFILPKNQINENKRCLIRVLIEDTRALCYKESVNADQQIWLNNPS